MLRQPGRRRRAARRATWSPRSTGEKVADGIALIVAIRAHQPGETVRSPCDAGRRASSRRDHPRLARSAERQSIGRTSSLVEPSPSVRTGGRRRRRGSRRTSARCSPRAGRLHPPLATAADLDRRQVAAADQRVDLRAGGAEHLGDVGQRQEPGRGGHGAIVARVTAPRRRRPAAPVDEGCRAAPIGVMMSPVSRNLGITSTPPAAAAGGHHARAGATHGCGSGSRSSRPRSWSEPRCSARPTTPSRSGPPADDTRRRARADRRRPGRTPGALRRRRPTSPLLRADAAAAGRPAARATASPPASCCRAPRGHGRRGRACGRCRSRSRPTRCRRASGPGRSSTSTSAPTAGARHVCAGAGAGRRHRGRRAGRPTSSGRGAGMLVLAVDQRGRPLVRPAAPRPTSPRSPWSAGADRGRRPRRGGRRRLGVAGARALLGDRTDVVVLKRCVDVDDLLATGSAGQADAAVVALDAPGLDRRGRRPPPPATGPRRRGRPRDADPDAAARRATRSASTRWSPTTT